MRWKVNDNGYVPLKEIAQRMNRVMETVKLACRRDNIPWRLERFSGEKGEMNGIDAADLPKVLTTLSNMARKKSRKGTRLRRRKNGAVSPPRSPRKEDAATRAARKGLAPFPVKPSLPVDEDADQRAETLRAAQPEPEKRPAVSYSNGLAPSGQWDAFVKAAENAARLAKAVDVVRFDWQADDGKVTFERNVVDSITIQ